jgi:DNA polymerase elongation subunit (family B)
MSPPPLRLKIEQVGFNLTVCVVGDVECYPGRWCLGLLGPGQTGELVSWMIDGDQEELERTLDALAERGRMLVTFNGSHFDVPVVRSIQSGLDPFEIATNIVENGKLPVAPSSLRSLGLDHIDLAARVRRGLGFPGLKRLAAYLGRPVLRDLPFTPGTILTDEQWEEVKKYNLIDLAHTWALLERFAPELEALSAVSAEQGFDLRSTATPRVVERVFASSFKRQRGREPILPEPPVEVLYRGAPGVRRPRTPEAAAWYDRVVGIPLPLVGEDDHRHPEVPRAQFTIGKLKVTVGAGGLHSSDSPRVHYSTRKCSLVSVDVASYYPTIIATKQITAGAYGEAGAELYRGILDRRFQIKRRAKETNDPEQARRLDVQATGLKLILNSTFGKFGNPYSTL